MGRIGAAVMQALRCCLLSRQQQSEQWKVLPAAQCDAPPFLPPPFTNLQDAMLRPRAVKRPGSPLQGVTTAAHKVR